ncbi:MAG: hypothetical protein E6I76_08865, partial [Chloroflexi bacterium]
MLEGADGELLDHPVAGQRPPRRGHRLAEVGAAEALRRPPLEPVGPRRGHHQAAAVLGDGGVPEEGQAGHPRIGARGGEQGAQVADGEDGGDGEAVELDLAAVAIEAQGAATGEVGDGRGLREGDQPGGVERHQPAARAARG